MIREEFLTSKSHPAGATHFVNGMLTARRTAASSPQEGSRGPLTPTTQVGPNYMPIRVPFARRFPASIVQRLCHYVKRSDRSGLGLSEQSIPFAGVAPQGRCRRCRPPAGSQDCVAVSAGHDPMAGNSQISNDSAIVVEPGKLIVQ